MLSKHISGAGLSLMSVLSLRLGSPLQTGWREAGLPGRPFKQRGGASGWLPSLSQGPVQSGVIEIDWMLFFLLQM